MSPAGGRAGEAGVGGEAAQLERGRHVHRAVERAADDRAEQRHPRAGAGGAPPGRVRWASAIRRASAASSGIMRVASEAVSAERNDSRRNPRSSSSGSTREARERGDQHQQRHLQRDHRPVHDRLDRQVALTERTEVAEPREHGQPVARDEHVDRDDRHGHDRGGAQRARQLATDAGADPRRAPPSQREQDQRVEQHERRRRERERPHGADARARGVQRAGEAAVEERGGSC